MFNEVLPTRTGKYTIFSEPERKNERLRNSRSKGAEDVASRMLEKILKKQKSCIRTNK